MHRSGNWLPTAVLLLGLLCTQAALAALEATVDRARVSMGDSLRLTISSDGSIDPAAANLAPLQRDFDILQRSSSSSTSIVNGQTTRSRELVLEITPRREGALTIPALSAGGANTSPIAVLVGPAPTIDSPDNDVVFTAEVDQTSVYVQQQVLLTLRIQQAINLDDRSITELAVEDAFVVPLGQNSYQRTADGRRWLVHEIRYAIFPEQSGALRIPAQTFAGRVRRGGRSLFDFSAGPRLSRSTDSLVVEVRSRPDSYPASTWLPASELQIEESWSTPPDQLKTGDSVTRTVTVTGKGLQGAQLPPVLFPPMEGLKYYPDQPVIEDAEDAAGVIGIRTDSAALVPVRPGTYRIPELRVAWWDTSTDALRYAVLPARDIAVSPARAAGGGEQREVGAVTGPLGQPVPVPTTGPDERQTLWQILAAVCALGWLATALLLLRRQRLPAAAAKPVSATAAASEAHAWKQLQAACAAGDGAAVRDRLQRWTRTLANPAQEQTLADFLREREQTALLAELARLDAFLYGAGAQGATRWDAADLLQAAKEMRQHALGARARRDNASPLPALYPTG